MTQCITKRPQPAYIFGGLEAIIFQGLVAGFLGGMLVIKGYWQRIKAYFSGETLEKDVSPENKQDPSDN